MKPKLDYEEIIREAARREVQAQIPQMIKRVIMEEIGLLTRPEAAAYLKCSVQTIDKLRLPIVKLNSDYRYRVSDIQTALEEKTIRP